MIDGLWLLQWSIEGTERSGVIVVNEGRALGGNAGFICTGMLSATGENVIGQLHIRQVNQALPPILPADRLPAGCAYGAASTSRATFRIVRN